MRGKGIIVAIFVVVLALYAAVPAMAGQQTGIINAANSVDYYEYTPTAVGTLTVTISYTRADGTGAPQYPEAEVDGVVQTYDSASVEDYWDVDVAGLYSGLNPCSGSYTVKASGVGKTIYIGVLGYIGQVPYRMVATYNATTVIDTGAIDIANPSQKWAYGVDADLYLPSVGTVVSGLQYWPGTLDRDAPASDVWANWDDYIYSRTETPLVENYSVEYTNTPAVWDITSVNASKTGKWYIPSPMKWTAAVRPNVWTDIFVDQYAKPGTSSVTTARAWYTVSWPDDAKAATPKYFWGTVPTTSASRANFSGSGDRSGKITFDFYGDTLDWYYTTWNRGGTANVTIDSTDKGNVNQYTSGFGYKAVASYTGLGDSAHTAVITNTGSKDTLSQGYWITNDGFKAQSDATDLSLMAENNMDVYTSYGWGVVNTTSASGDSFAGSGDREAGFAFSFTGTSITYIFTKWNRGGHARVYIDGVDKGTVNQYSSSFAFQQSQVFGGLAPTVHTILIVNNKTKDTPSLGYWLTLDAFDVGGTLYQN